MSEHLFVRLEQDERCGWVALDSQGRRLTGTRRGALAQAGAAAAGRRVTVLVPGPYVITTRAKLPVKSPARIRQMLPYSLEEALAQDVEQLAFAAGPRTPSGEVPVSVVGKALLEGWLERLRAAGLVPHAVYADSEGVPDTPGTLTLVIEGERIYGRRPGQPPFVFEGLALSQTFELLEAGAGPSQDLQHLLVYADQPGHDRFEAELPGLGERAASLDVRFLEDGVLEQFAATLVNRPGTNLLQGAYAPKSNWAALLRPWRLAAGLLIGLIGLSALGQGVQYLSLRQQDRALTALVEASCQRVFSEPQLARCRSAVQSRLAQSGVPSAAQAQSVLAVLGALAEAKDAQSRIEALSYRNGVTDLRVTAPSVPALDELARRMSATRRFEVRIQSANTGDAGVEGRLQITGTAP